MIGAGGTVCAGARPAEELINSPKTTINTAFRESTAGNFHKDGIIISHSIVEVLNDIPV
jgi:hypothetical protein